MSKKPESGLTIISGSTSVEGQFNVNENLRVEGKIKGTVQVDGELIITESGMVEGQIKAGTAIIAGTLIGNLDVESKTILEPKSLLQGDLKTRFLLVEEGACLNGNCSMEKTNYEKQKPQKSLL